MNKMNRNILLIFVAVLFLAAGAYMYQQSQPGMISNQYQQGTPTVTPTSYPEGTPAKMASSITINLKEQNESGESGTAVISDQGNGKAKVEIMLSGFTQGVSQPTHIHLGACPDVAGVKYPLTNVVNGKSTTVLNVSLAQLKSELPLGLNVHKSTSEASVYTACGDLKF